MTLRTDFYVDLRLCRTCNECVSTVAGNGCLIIIWMDSFSHDFHLFIFLSFSVISLPADSGFCHTLYTRMPDPHMILVTRATLSRPPSAFWRCRPVHGQNRLQAITANHGTKSGVLTLCIKENFIALLPFSTLLIAPMNIRPFCKLCLRNSSLLQPAELWRLC